MPVYEFRCSDCGKTFDKISPHDQRDSGETPPCPACGSASTSRLVLRLPCMARPASTLTGGGPDRTGQPRGLDHPWNRSADGGAP